MIHDSRSNLNGLAQDIRVVDAALEDAISTLRHIRNMANEGVKANEEGGNTILKSIFSSYAQACTNCLNRIDYQSTNK
jgi:hypothetical protein